MHAHLAPPSRFRRQFRREEGVAHRFFMHEEAPVRTAGAFFAGSAALRAGLCPKPPAFSSIRELAG